MMGIRPNPAQLSVKTSVKYVSLHDNAAEMNSMGPFSSWWWTKLSRVKLLGLIAFFWMIVTFLTYHIAIGYSSSPIQESGNSVMTSSARSVSSSTDSEEFSEKIRYKHTKRRLPQCIIIGIRKAGTRALSTYLNLHPHIESAAKEIHFFDDSDKFRYGFEWYRKKMPYSYPEQITIEKTPAYFATKVVPDRVYLMNSSIRLLLIVREPVDRTVSDYLQITLKKQGKNLPTYPFEEMVLRNGEVDASYQPLKRSLYWMYMENWLRKFDLSQFHIIDGDVLVKNPLVEIQAVEKFLGLEHRITKENFFFNQSHGFYCIRNETREKCLAESKGRPHPAVDPAVVKQLKDFFRPYNERFFQLIGRRFDWD